MAGKDLNVELNVMAKGQDEIKKAETNILKLTETLQKLNAAGKDTSGIVSQVKFFQTLIDTIEKTTGALGTASRQYEEFQAKTAKSSAAATKRTANSIIVENAKRELAEMKAIDAQRIADKKQAEAALAQAEEDAVKAAEEKTKRRMTLIASMNTRERERKIGALAVEHTSVPTSEAIAPLIQGPQLTAHEAARRAAGRTPREPEQTINAGSSAFNPENAEKFGDGIGKSADKSRKGLLLIQHELKHFVAMFDDLSRHQFGQLLSSIGAAARDAGLGIMGLGGSVAALAVVMVARGIGENAKKYAELAEKTRDAAAAAGMGVQDYSALQGALQLTGMKADAADSAMRMFGAHVAEAIENPSSKAAKALNALGLSNQYLHDHMYDMQSIFLKAADGLHGFANSAEKAQAMEILWGKGSEHIGDLSERGAQGIKSLEEEAKRLGIVLDENTVKSLTTTGNKIDHLGTVIEGQAMQSFAAWGPVIQWTTGLLEDMTIALGTVTTGIGKMIAGENQAKPGHWVTKGPIHQYIEDVVKPVQGPPIPEKAQMAPVNYSNAKSNTDEMDKIRYNVNQAGEAAVASAPLNSAAQGVARLRAELQTLQDAIKNAGANKLTADDVLSLKSQSAEKQTQLIESTTRVAVKAAKQSYEEFAATEKQKIAEAEGDAIKVRAIYTEWAAAAKTIYNQDAKTQIDITTAKFKALALLARNAAKDQISDIAEQAKAQNSYAGALVSQNKINKFNKLDPDGDKDDIAQAEADGNDIVNKAKTAIALLQAKIVEFKAQRDAANKEGDNAGASAAAASMAEAQDTINAIVKDTNDAVMTLYKNSGIATDGIAGFFKDMFTAMDSGSQEFAKSFFAAVVAPQQELRKAGLTTIKVNTSGQQLKQAASQFFIGMGDSLVEEARKGLVKIAAQQLLKIPMVQSLASKFMPGLDNFGLDKATSSDFGAAAGKTGSAVGEKQLGINANISASQLKIFGEALTETTAALHSLVSAITPSTAAHAVHAPTVSVSTSTHGVHAGAVLTSTVAHISNAEAVMASSLQHILHAAKVALDTVATELDTTMKLVLAGFEGGGVVPSAAGGMVTGSTGGARLAILHAKEMVLPAHLSEGVQRAINGGSFGQGGSGGGGNTTTHNSNASLTYAPNINMGGKGGKGGMSRNELSSMLQTHATSIIGEARTLQRKGWRP